MAKKASSKAAKASTDKPAAVVIDAFKGFDSNWQCRGFQYEVGQTYYTHASTVVRCASGGFHSCENPLDVWGYYGPATSKFAAVQASGAIDKAENEDTKIASANIAIRLELRLPEFIKRGVEWILAAAKNNGAVTTGYRAHAASTGNYAHAASTGNYAHAASTGNYAHAASTGNYAHAASTGDGAHAASTGDGAHAASTGDGAVAATLGHGGRAKAGKNGAIVLSRWVEAESRYRVAVGYVGENGIEADTWYGLNDEGEIVAVVAED
ncbi:DUF7666 domain-containing protein [Luteibacter yeojuensis]|uniref:DUF7666 domain-containing protein n=1 Tax=Luteibacter yeojuensis TaxID=345309 RepID=A0A7X5TQ45_9GAMM|nr:hypothetical protein [Luteibacter yeojuensis]NID15424.1 hypothetical protein [Luteibacter yeojuensis]